MSQARWLLPQWLARLKGASRPSRHDVIDAATVGKDWQFDTEQDTLEFAARLSVLLKPGRVIHLTGPLGAGKTALVRHMLRALGLTESVPSPTFALVYSYPLKDLTVHHFDLYRVLDPQELELIGIRDYFDEHSCCLIEWPDRGHPVLPAADINIEIAMHGTVPEQPAGLASAGGRQIRLSVHEDERSLLNQIDQQHWKGQKTPEQG